MWGGVSLCGDGGPPTLLEDSAFKVLRSSQRSEVKPDNLFVLSEHLDYLPSAPTDPLWFLGGASVFACVTHGRSLLYPLVAEGGLPSEGPGTNLLLSLQNLPMVLFVLSKFIMNPILIFQRRRPDLNHREIGALQGAAGVRGRGPAAEWTVEEETGRISDH